MKESGFRFLIIKSCSKASNLFHGAGRWAVTFVGRQNSFHISALLSIWLGKSFNLTTGYAFFIWDSINYISNYFSIFRLSSIICCHFLLSIQDGPSQSLWGKGDSAYSRSIVSCWTWLCSNIGKLKSVWFHLFPSQKVVYLGTKCRKSQKDSKHLTIAVKQSSTDGMV